MSIAQRRKPGASGTPILLGDGRTWLMPSPSYVAGYSSLSKPDIDQHLDNCFDAAINQAMIGWRDLFGAARELLKVNYFVTDEELMGLFTFEAAAAKTFASTFMDIMFGPEDPDKTRTLWIRATLLANGLGGLLILPEDLQNVLDILVATKRTIPLEQFADACLDAAERRSLAMLRGSVK